MAPMSENEPPVVQEPTPQSVKVVFEYDNMDALHPHHVDGLQGVVTPSGDLHLSFYSEYMLPADKLEATASIGITDSGTFKVSAAAPDPFAVDPAANVVRIRRRLECSIVVKASAVRPWAQFFEQKVAEMDSQVA